MRRLRRPKAGTTAPASPAAGASVCAGRLALIGTAAALSILLFAASATTSAWFPSQQMPDFSTPKGLYEAGCQYCHAADGRGVDLATVGFDVPLPDFADCSFATREPDADWFIVTHQGGPIRGFANNMPSFADAFNDEQIEQVVGYLRVFCTDERWPRGELNFPRPFVTEKAYPEDEWVFTLGGNADGLGAVTGKFVYERRIGPAGQIEIEVPVGINRIEAGGAWLGGIGDIEIGYKQVLARSLDKGMIFSANLGAKLPTGSEERGLGGGAFKIEPFASAGFGLPANGYVHLQVGGEISTDTDKSAHEAFYRAAIGTTLTAGRFGRAFSPMVEILGLREFEHEGTVNELDLLPQVQVTLNTRQHVMASFGVRFPATHRAGRSTQILFYLLWEWFDGGLFDGW